jgi:hypothetical protein
MCENHERETSEESLDDVKDYLDRRALLFHCPDCFRAAVEADVQAVRALQALLPSRP